MISSNVNTGFHAGIDVWPVTPCIFPHWHIISICWSVIIFGFCFSYWNLYTKEVENSNEMLIKSVREQQRFPHLGGGLLRFAMMSSKILTFVRVCVGGGGSGFQSHKRTFQRECVALFVATNEIACYIQVSPHFPRILQFWRASHEKTCYQTTTAQNKELYNSVFVLRLEFSNLKTIKWIAV